jgi:hypothetical protein
MRSEGRRSMKAWMTGLIACSRLIRSPVLLVVLAQHRAREVDRQHDVVALRADFALVLDPLGAGERADDKGEPGEREPAASATRRQATAGARPPQRARAGRARGPAAQPDGPGRASESPGARAGRPGRKLAGQNERTGSAKSAHRWLPAAPVATRRASARGRSARARRNGPPLCGRRGGSGGREEHSARPPRGGAPGGVGGPVGGAALERHEPAAAGVVGGEHLPRRGARAPRDRRRGTPSSGSAAGARSSPPGSGRGGKSPSQRRTLCFGAARAMNFQGISGGARAGGRRRVPAGPSGWPRRGGSSRGREPAPGTDVPRARRGRSPPGRR